MVYAHTSVVFSVSTYSGFAVLQSRTHEVWALFQGSTFEDRPIYTPTTCFRTFPFLQNWLNHSSLKTAGRAYYHFRSNLMVRNNEGMTETYNRFHDPNERDPGIAKLRELHAAMDRAVLDAYGWTDIQTDCKFLLDYEIDEEEWGNKKRPWRYRWPDELHDEVLARLLALNEARAVLEAQAEKADKPEFGSKPAARRARELSALSLPFKGAF